MTWRQNQLLSGEWETEESSMWSWCTGQTYEFRNVRMSQIMEGFQCKHWWCVRFTAEVAEMELKSCKRGGKRSIHLLNKSKVSPIKVTTGHRSTTRVHGEGQNSGMQNSLAREGGGMRGLKYTKKSWGRMKEAHRQKTDTWTQTSKSWVPL